MVALLALAMFMPTACVDQCDVVELNHFHDITGKPCFDQLIFWEWDAANREMIVKAWRMQNEPEVTLLRDCGGIVATWFDRETRCHREVRASHFRESWTQHDPERANRKLRHETERTGLIKRVAK